MVFGLEPAVVGAAEAVEGSALDHVTLLNVRARVSAPLADPKISSEVGS
jgi:hypothetical protein